MNALVPVEALLAGLTARHSVAPETVDLAGALGLVLAAPLVAPAALPARRTAIRTGWAVASSELAGASPYAPVRPATPPRLVSIGEALHPGADTLLPPDAIESVDAEVSFEVAPGEGVRGIGGDAGAGACLVEAGRRPRAADLAAAAALGLTVASVRRPRVRVIGAGPAGDLLVAGCTAAGAETEIQPGGWPAADLLLVLVRSRAERQSVADALGNGLVAARVALRPGGEDMLGGLREGGAVLAVPDRVEAALAGLVVLVVPLLARLAGLGGSETSNPTGRLARKLVSRIGLSELALLRRRADGTLDPLGVGDLSLASIAAAEAWLLASPESEGYAAGAVVEARRLR